MEELLHAGSLQGHQVDLISTNGTKGMLYSSEATVLKALENERLSIKKGQPYDIDITFTAPPNFRERFLPTSKVKMALYDYESSIMPPAWKPLYSTVDFVIPSSEYVAKMFARNGCPTEKIVTVHHGVDTRIFNPQAKPISLNTKKRYKFLCVAEPHYRKQLPQLLELYYQEFNSNDDVCLVLKTKIFKDGEEIKPYEQDLRKTITALNKKYGTQAPELLIISERLPSLAGLYTACDSFVLMTSSEGWGIPYLEALACELPIVAPKWGGQLDFLNPHNSLLTKCGTRKALKQEQYWGYSPGAITGAPDPVDFASRMRDLYTNHHIIKAALLPGMRATIPNFTWDLAFQKIVEIAKSTGRLIEK